VVFAVTATGDPNMTCCQPLAVSPMKVAAARCVPFVDQRLPTWVPVLAALL
jgi:hypothetical protein